MKIIIPIIQDINDYLVVQRKTISRIAIADIMDNKMLIRWYSKILDSAILIKDLKGIGYFESEFSHGYLQATFYFNNLAKQVITFQLEMRNLNAKNSTEVAIIEKTFKKLANKEL